MEGTRQAQEKRFSAFYFSEYRRHLQIAAAAGLVLYCLFGVLDYLLYPQYIDTLALLRYGVVTPVVAGALLYLYRGRSARLAQALYAMSLAVGGSAIGAVVIIAGDPHQLYYTGFILSLIFTYAVSGLRLIYSIPSGLFMSLVFCAALIRWQVVPSEVLVNDIFGTIACNLAGIAAGYLLEQHRRREFRYRMELEAERNGLAADNRALSFLSRHDPLTGLKNRLAFGNHMEEEWKRAQRQAYPLALLMVDIDDFKAYNDTAGHVAGDAVLKRVGEVLARSASRPGDMAARYGGEEFAILMVGTTLEGAVQKGWELVEKVRRLAIPHPASEDEVLTVSVGCAAVIPQEGEDFVKLVQAADQALYRAKEAGKDRCST